MTENQMHYTAYHKDNPKWLAYQKQYRIDNKAALKVKRDAISHETYQKKKKKLADIRLKKLQLEAIENEAENNG